MSSTDKLNYLLETKEAIKQAIQNEGVTVEDNTTFRDYAEKVTQVGRKSLYLVGSIFISVEPTSPAEYFGGTWEQLENRFLLGASSTYGGGTTGGEATHTLTVNEMPSHNHRVALNNDPNTQVVQKTIWGSNTPGFVSSSTTDISYGSDVGFLYTTLAVGGGQSHNNMPPYLAVYMWKRVA